MDKINALILDMLEFDVGEPELIQHFLKVYEFAKLIGSMENISSDDMAVLEAVSILHDIGIKVCMQKYGKCNGKLQEQEGPAYAEEMLRKLDFKPELIKRVSYLVAHHHTYTDIDRIDYQILVEADFLVNLYENGNDKESIKSTYNKIFKTEAGRRLCSRMILIED